VIPLGDQDTEGRIVLKWIFKKYGEKEYAGYKKL
jgi:hypothetical protein